MIGGLFFFVRLTHKQCGRRDASQPDRQVRPRLSSENQKEDSEGELGTEPEVEVAGAGATLQIVRFIQLEHQRGGGGREERQDKTKQNQRRPQQ